MRRLAAQLRDALALLREMAEVDAALEAVVGDCTVVGAVIENSEEVLRLARPYVERALALP